MDRRLLFDVTAMRLDDGDFRDEDSIDDDHGQDDPETEFKVDYDILRLAAGSEVTITNIN